MGGCGAANPLISYLLYLIHLFMWAGGAAKLKACRNRGRGCPVELSKKSIREHERAFCKYHADEKLRDAEKLKRYKLKRAASEGK